MNNIFFNAHHSPIGAFSSFTLGFKGSSGGLGIELGRPANQNIFIGVEARDGSQYEALPFFVESEDESRRYDVEKCREEGADIPLIRQFPCDSIKRDFSLTSDTWTAGDMTFCIYNPVCPIPEPGKASDDEMKKAIVPAVFVEITIDNTKCARERRAFFGYEGNDPYSGMRHIEGSSEKKITGIGQGKITAITTSDKNVKSAQAFSIGNILSTKIEENWLFGLPMCSALIMNVNPGQKETFRFAVCFYMGGIVTSGIEASYYYAKYFKSIEEVSEFALENFDELTENCKKAAQNFNTDNLSDEQKFMFAHSVKSYYGSTQFLEYDGKPLYIVNEGEYRMMNTMDLVIDQVFYELRMNPWTVKNELETYLEYYSYYDTIRFPGETDTYEGGISFCHDIGVANVFSRKGHSSYEMQGLKGCFSHMTSEQLINWILCAALYIEQSGDKEFLNKHLDVLKKCFLSLVNRDNPDESSRNGVIGLDSSRTMGGAEITTYDSLDASLSQARNNLYLAGKCWAAYVVLEKIFKETSQDDLAKEAGLQAEKCAATIIENVSEDGSIPAILNEGSASRIIPAIEGLVFPYLSGCKDVLDYEGRFGNYLKALKRHLEVILVPGVCIFDDGGWKLSSTSNNSWLSKIYLSQFIAKNILGMNLDTTEADKAHVEWLVHPELSYWSWSDQIISGKIIGSKYYPRGVTSILWT